MWCELCHAGEGEWVHQLDPAKLEFRKYGKGHTWADQVRVCERCDQLLRDQEFEALVALQVGVDPLTPGAIEEEIRKPFAVYCAAYLRTVSRDDLLPLGVRALRSEGFVPVGELTGEPDFAQGWPVQHRRSIPETRPLKGLGEWTIDDELFWLIRSPWPNISLTDAFEVVWDYVHLRGPIVDSRIDPDQQRAAIGEFASLDESRIAALIARRRAQEDENG
jgi:hypothetical protein